ncbi:MAG: endonuclease III domain-containing protein [Deltaproteobacteria bacterium]|nr:endonuclease III domain-containing protein [Deltaproteobacteria bacterium]
MAALPNPTAERLKEMFDLMFRRFGPQHWWPGQTPLEIMVGAVLTQNTNWKNVEKAIQNLKERNLLSLETLHGLSLPELGEVVRPAGFYNLKAKRLRNLLDLIMGRYGGDLQGFLLDEPSTLRDALLSVKGIGRETADSILLYAAQVPVFVIDAYTYRIFHRHGIVDEQVSYEELQALFMENLPEDLQLFNEFHALIVRAGKEFCRKEPRCGECPLEHWGPVSPQD